MQPMKQENQSQMPVLRLTHDWTHAYFANNQAEK